ncbi:MAG: hemerythrin domain-containing protein [Pyrinomonadaceae bacterium]
MTTFDQLLDLHNDIDELFFAHQCSLLRFEFVTALSQLDQYESLLLRHMQDEEDHLLPMYAERAIVEKAGAPQIFWDDHSKMRAYVEQFKEQTIKLAGEAHPEESLLLLLDRESFYKRLCSHHDKREREHLYPALNSICSESERNEILARVMCDIDLSRSTVAAERP